MTAIMIVSGLFALGALAVTILPFFTGRGGFLAAAGTINDPIRLEAMKVAIVARYVKEEVTFAEGDLSKREWTRRQEYLRHRYIDLVRRLDFLRRVGSSSTAKSLIIALAFGGLDQLLLPQTASAAVVIGQRHAIMLRGGVDQIWGHYVFTLQNDSKVTGEFTTPVMLPTGAIDLRPQEVSTWSVSGLLLNQSPVIPIWNSKPHILFRNCKFWSPKIPGSKFLVLGLILIGMGNSRVCGVSRRRLRLLIGSYLT